MLRATTIANGSTVYCVQSIQRNVTPLVNVFSAQRVILRMMRRERYRGSLLNRGADEPLSVVVHQSAMCGVRPMPGPVGAGRMRAPLAVLANGGVPCGTDVMTPTYACAIPASTLLRVIDRLPTIA
jgi:hypothetical protein